MKARFRFLPGAILFLGVGLAWADSVIEWDRSSRRLEVSESDGCVVLTAVRAGDLSTEATVDYSAVSRTATEGDDFVATSGRLLFLPGVHLRTLLVPILNDIARESTETFDVILEDLGPGAVVNAYRQATIAIRDNDLGLGFNPDRVAQVTEKDGEILLEVRRGNDGDFSFAVDYATSDGSARAGADYEAVSGTLEFPPGVETRLIRIPVLTDDELEGTEFLNVVLDHPTEGVVLAGLRRVIVRILDATPSPPSTEPPEVGFDFQAYEWLVDESALFVDLAVRRLPLGSAEDGRAPAFSVDYQTVEATATAGLDYQAVSGTLYFSPVAERQQIRIPLLGDGIREIIEVFYVQLSNPTPGVSLSPSSRAMIRIRDNDTGVEFADAGVTTAEDAGTARLQVLRGNDGLLGVFSVDYATVDGTAVAGDDYVRSVGTLTFETGEWVKDLGIPVINDGTHEAQESFQVVLSNPTGGLWMGLQPTATVQINDNDRGVWIAGGGGAMESDARVTLSVVRGPDGDLPPFSVDYLTIEGTARAGEDFVASEGTLEFAAGETEKSLSIPLLNDTEWEETERFLIRLLNPSGGVPVAWPWQVPVDIFDNDRGLYLSGDMRVSEDAGAFRIWVNRGSDLARPFSVNVVPTGISASPGVDFDPVIATVSFGPEDQSLPVDIPVLNDGLQEPDETLVVRLDVLYGDGARVVPGYSSLSRTLVIRDNDPGPAFVETPSEVRVGEEAGMVELSVRRGNDADLSPRRIPFEVRSESAEEGEDVQGLGGDLEFPAGVSQAMLRIAVVDDLRDEGDETFSVRLNGSPAEPSEVRVRILDNDGPLQWERVRANPAALMEVTPTEGAFGHNRFVLIADYAGACLSSDDGLNWIQSPVPNGLTDLVDIVFGNGRFLAVSARGEVLLSEDGLSWRAGAPIAPMGVGGRLAFAVNRFLAWSGERWEPPMTLAVSADGEDWEEVVIDGLVNDIAGGNGVLVAVGPSGLLLSSPDGRTWTRHEPGLEASFQSVAFGDGSFVVLSATQWDETAQREYLWALTSPDGLSWSVQRVEVGGLYLGPERLVFQDGVFYVLNGSAAVRRFHLIEGIPVLDSWAGPVLWNLLFGGGYQVGCGSDGIVVSIDGEAWANLDAPLLDLAWADGLFVAVGGRYGGKGRPRATSVVLTSEDGDHWGVLPLTSDGPWRTVAGGGGVFVIASDQSWGSVPESSLRAGDWQGWRAIAELPPPRWLEYSRGRFLGAWQDSDRHPRLYLSDDGRRWSVIQSPSLWPTTSLAAGTEGFLMTTEMGEVFATKDGQAWSLVSSVAAMAEVAFAAGAYTLQIPDRPWMLSSEDGENWRPLSLPPLPSGCRNLGSLGSLAMGTVDDTVWLSRQGQPWRAYGLPSNPSWFSADTGVFANGRYYLFGGSGQVYRSNPVLVLHRMSWSPEGLRFSVTCEAGVTYAIEESPDLGDWSTVGVVTATGSTMESKLEGMTGSEMRFVRVTQRLSEGD